MSEDFDPKEHDRKLREEGYSEETEMICHVLKTRGDERIGQLLINSIRNLDRYQENDEVSVYDILWNIEAPELLEAMKNRKG